jgi:hypothetical protein
VEFQGGTGSIWSMWARRLERLLRTNLLILQTSVFDLPIPHIVHPRSPPCSSVSSVVKSFGFQFGDFGNFGSSGNIPLIRAHPRESAVNLAFHFWQFWQFLLASSDLRSSNPPPSIPNLPPCSSVSSVLKGFFADSANLVARCSTQSLPADNPANC